MSELLFLNNSKLFLNNFSHSPKSTTVFLRRRVFDLYNQILELFSIPPYIPPRSVRRQRIMQQLQNELKGKVIDTMHVVEFPMRQLQASSYRCIAKCCLDESLKDTAFSDCKIKCEGATKKADKFIQEQMKGFEVSVQQCSVSCAQQLQASGRPMPRSAQEYEEALMPCFQRCAKKSLTTIPDIQRKIVGHIKDEIKY